ncbi:MAG: glycosyltransferase [Lactobacillaceae bacterium]|jgi:glycosyltransferase involved in cell wall biosynthesis|nr:glycosyltransferase [Lactobacillaceae bacterium]
MTKERLTVLVVTYNHVKYFEKCMDSILSQKTDFGFKIHVVDDKSTDGTTDLVKKYAEKYPDKVKAYIREQNYGVVKNIYEGIKSVDTEYYAFIESDDYWCDDYKLQKQVDILDTNTDCSFSGHNTINNYPEDPENKKNGKKFFKVKTQKFSFPKKFKKKDFIKIHPSSRVYRTSCLDLENIRSIEVPVWDSTSYWWFLSKGKLHYLDEVMSVYNRTDTGVFSGASKEKRDKMSIRNILSVNKEFDYKRNDLFLSILKRRKFVNFINYIRLKYFTKPKKIEQEYCKLLGYAMPVRIYTSVAENNLGDMLNYYLLEFYGKAYLRAYIEDANLLAIGSVFDKIYVNKRLKKDLSKEVNVLGSGFISDFETYKSAKPKTLKVFARKLNILALRGKTSKQRCEDELGKSFDNIPLGDPGLLANRLIDAKSVVKKYDVGIIPHYTDKKSELFDRIKLEKYTAKVIDVSGDTLETLKEIAGCRVILSSAMHGLICADSFGIPNKWLEVSDNVFGGGYKFADYYSVFGIKNPEPIDLRKKQVSDKDIEDVISSYAVSATRVEEICAALSETYKNL